MSSGYFYFFHFKIQDHFNGTILKNVTNFSTTIGELCLVDKRQSAKVWTAMFVMVRDILYSLICLFQINLNSFH